MHAVPGSPQPLILMTVFISPWLRWQQREDCVPLRVILARLIPPVSLARLILPVILARPVAPPLARAAVFPESCVPSSSAAAAEEE